MARLIVFLLTFLLFAQVSAADSELKSVEFYEEGRLDEALLATEQELAQGADEAGMRILRARIFIGKKDWDQAAAEAGKALAKEPASGEAHSVMGQAHFGKEDFKRAAQHFEKAVKAGSTVPEGLHDVALLYTYGQDYEAAIRQAKKVLETNPNSAPAHYAAGRFYVQTERYDDALPYLEKARDLEPDDLKIREFLALAYAESGRTAKGKDIAREILEEDPSNETAKLIVSGKTGKPQAR